MNAVSSGRRAKVQNRIPNSACRGGCDLIHFEDSNTHRIDQRVTGIIRMEIDFPTHRRNSYAVAITGDPFHNVLKQVAIFLHHIIGGRSIFQRTKPERIKQSDWAGTHGQDVTDNASNSSGGSLIWLHVGRVIVGFDLHRNPISIAKGNHAGVFKAASFDRLFIFFEAGEDWAAVLVSTMLGPHDGKHSKFGVAGRTSQ